MTVAEIANSLPPRPFSSREFIREMGKYLDKVGIKTDKSIIYSAYKKASRFSSRHFRIVPPVSG